MQVYSMGTYCEIEDELVTEAMLASGLPTAQEAVQYALELLIELKTREQDERSKINASYG